MCLENKKAKSPLLLNSTMVVRSEFLSEELSFKKKKKFQYIVLIKGSSLA